MRTRNRLSVLEMPAEFQLNASRRFGEKGHNGFFRALVGGLGLNLAIGKTMAWALFDGFEWPAFRRPDDPAWRWLYVARSPTANLVKIGLSADPIARMFSLRSAIPVCKEHHDFELMGALPFCTPAHETALCKLFAGSRRFGREWFHETPATRILSWYFVHMRSQAGIEAERRRLTMWIEPMLVGLRYVHLGKEPWFGHEHGLNGYGRRCRICRSRRHDARKCPERHARAA